MSRGHRIFAAVYDRLGAAAERGWLGKRRHELLAGAHGEVLEIGGGTGANLRYYRDVDRVVVTEPDPAMRARLPRRLPQAEVPVEISDAAAVPFPDASFDTVVSTLVLCSVGRREPLVSTMLDSVRESTTWERWEQLLRERDPDPVAVLRAASQFLRYFETVRGEAVKAARHGGRTWEEIGEAMGVTRQAAWARFGDAEGREITSIALRRRFGS